MLRNTLVQVTLCSLLGYLNSLKTSSEFFSAQGLRTLQNIPDRISMNRPVQFDVIEIIVAVLTAALSVWVFLCIYYCVSVLVSIVAHHSNQRCCKSNSSCYGYIATHWSVVYPERWVSYREKANDKNNRTKKVFSSCKESPLCADVQWV